MILDLFMQAMSAIVTPVLSLLPQGHLQLPAASGLAGQLQGLDSLIPILGPMQLAAGILAALIAFVGFRIVVFLRYLLLP